MSENAAQTQAAGQPVQTPPDFPITWNDPSDAKLTWIFSSAIKEPVPALVEAVAKAFLEGGNAGYEMVELPIRVRVELFNTYQYFGMVPVDAPPEVVMKGMGLLNRAAPGVFKSIMKKMGEGMSKKSEAVLDPLVARLEPYWCEELLPEIQQHLAYFESSDLRGLSLNQLQAHMTEALKRTSRLGELHGIALLLMLYGLSQFEEFYTELFPGSTTLDALRLTQGLDNKTVAGDRALWRLSRTARSIPEVQAILTSQEPETVIAALEASTEGQSFLSDLRTWLAEYGRRLNSVFSFLEPSWIEDPTPAIRNLQAYVTQVEARPEMAPAMLAAEREQAITEARAKIAAYPQPVKDRFEMLLKAGQMATIVHEDHNFWIDQRFIYQIQRLILEFGRRYVQAGILETTYDVFYLTPEELQNGRQTNYKKKIEERKATLAHFSQVAAPPMIGTAPPFDMTDTVAVIRAIFKGEVAQPSDSQPGANMVQGLAGSAGLIRGTARVLHSLTDAKKLQPGDILITVATEPPWTPLFATAAAVVTDNGGVLSHTAVVAREYRIPAVVGTGRATSTFQDGQLIEVDGNAGIVRVVVEEAQREPVLVG
ncbi:MAG: PEP-utilizing enzyme [Candidatus Promineifilaceae bacterium]|nr:PEP-utilizing enzyme [Candidatus Promineifilaceae bacterium]